jgi:hypothetical protein
MLEGDLSRLYGEVMEWWAGDEMFTCRVGAAVCWQLLARCPTSISL